MSDDSLFQQVEELTNRIDRHEANELVKFKQLVELQQNNTNAISELTSQVASLVSDTRDIIQLHKDIKGATRLGQGLQRFMVWVVKWGFIGTGVAAVITVVTEYFE